VLFAGSCKKTTVVVVDLGYDYFPVEIGRYVVYDVDSIFIDEPVDIADTFYYQIKEVIAGEYIDNQGDLAQRIERFRRTSDTLPWVIKDVWASNRLPQSGQRVEENVRIIRMIFPVKDGMFWDANALNIEQERPLTYAEYNVPRVINGMAFDKTTMVVTTLEPNFVDTIIDTEIRAKNVGLVFKKLVETNTQIDGTTGFKLTMTVVEYGQE
jgi:hypothetical protein